MVLSTIEDQVLRRALARAARPDEEVVAGLDRIVRALEFGFPRIAVQWKGEAVLDDADGRPVPQVGVRRDALAQWRHEWGRERVPVPFGSFVAERFRLELRTGHEPNHVDRTLRDLQRLGGGPLPDALRGLARRVLEFPAAYVDGRGLEELTGLTSGALKERFRRRALPSPFSYLRWLRCLAVASLMREGLSVADTARRLGWANTGNLCRLVLTTVGHPPSEFAKDGAWEELLVGFVEGHMEAGVSEGWNGMESLFLRVA